MERLTGGTFNHCQALLPSLGPHPSWARFLPRVLAPPAQAAPKALWSMVDFSRPASPAHPEPRSCTSLPSTSVKQSLYPSGLKQPREVGEEG